MTRKYPPKDLKERMYRWRHNSFIGMAVMMKRNAQNIVLAPSTSTEAKAAASVIYDEAVSLEQFLRAQRIDPE